MLTRQFDFLGILDMQLQWLLVAFVVVLITVAFKLYALDFDSIYKDMFL